MYFYCVSYQIQNISNTLHTSHYQTVSSLQMVDNEIMINFAVTIISSFPDGRSFFAVDINIFVDRKISGFSEKIFRKEEFSKGP